MLCVVVVGVVCWGVVSHPKVDELGPTSAYHFVDLKRQNGNFWNPSNFLALTPNPHYIATQALNAECARFARSLCSLASLAWRHARIARMATCSLRSRSKVLASLALIARFARMATCSHRSHGNMLASLA